MSPSPAVDHRFTPLHPDDALGSNADQNLVLYKPWRERAVVLVGVAPNRNGEAYPALSGGPAKVLCAVMGVSWRTWHLCFERVNLHRKYPGPANDRPGSGDAEPNRELSQRVAAAMLSRVTTGRSLVLLGNHVTEAFGILRARHVMGPITRHLPTGDVHLYRLPHPSGLNRWWNSEENRSLAKSLLRKVAAEVVPHITDPHHQATCAHELGVLLPATSG